MRTVHALMSLTAMAVLTGCASVNFDHSISRVNQETAAFTGGELTWARTDSQREALAHKATALLASPLGQDDAVRLALINSPALQALLAQGMVEAASAAQSGRIANPVFSLERLVTGAEVELSRALSVGLLDLVTLPLRQGVAARRVEQSQLRLTGEVVDQVTRIRQAWVRAVASTQTLHYAKRVYTSAEASAELARRMHAAGNMSTLNRAREQSFYADAAIRLAAASHQATAGREALVRLLGLTQGQMSSLKLPERLPDLPTEVLAAQDAGKRAMHERLDVRIAQASLEAASKAQGLAVPASLTDIELTAQRNSTFNNDTLTSERTRGYEVAVRLPIFDWGNLQRDAMNARTLAAAQELESAVRTAGSNLRESYSAYRTAHDIARHYRDEVVPLRKRISEENQLRYNGMIIGVFELLADARDQVAVVMAAIDSEQQFWLAQAALQADLIGRPTSMTLTAKNAAAGATGGGH